MRLSTRIDASAGHNACDRRLLLAATWSLIGLAFAASAATAALTDAIASDPSADVTGAESESNISVTAAAPVGTKYLLVSSFECTIPGCNYENSVLRYNGTNGAFLGVHAGNIPGAYGMAIHPRTGRLLVVSRDRSEVTEHDARTGAFLRTFITAGNSGLNAPQNILFNAAGNILITSIPVQTTPNAVNGILEFDGNTGAFLRIFVNGGTINPLFPEDCGQTRCLRGANGMAFAINANGSLGNLYVASSVNDLILEYNGTTGAYVGVFDSSRLLAPNGLLVRTGTLRPGNLVVTSTWDNPNLTNDFQKIVEFDKNTRELITTNSGILASGMVNPGPLRWHLDTNVNPPLLRLLVGERISSIASTNADRVMMRTEAGTSHVSVFTPAGDTSLHIPTAMLHIAFGWASCDGDGDNDVDLKDIAAYYQCRSAPNSACLTIFDDDQTGNLSTYDFQACLAKAAGPPFPCTSSGQCNDANPCTTDTCSSGTCIYQVRPDNTSCADASFCDGAEVCRGGICSAPIPCVDTAHCDETNDRCRPCISNAECNDSNVCTIDTCNLNTGCVYTAAAGSCNDGNACTINDTCQAGVCVGPTPRNCNDNNVCTDDSCDTGTGCLHVHNLNPCNDNSICTLEDFCLLGTCRGSNPIDCNDGEQCTTDFCHPVQGCQNTNSNLACDDHNDCTENDVCSNGVCNGVPADCDDGIACTDDACVDGVCVNSPVNSRCADNLFCNGTETCSPVNGCVSSGNPCANGPVCQNTCIEATDSCLSPQGTPCTNDGNPCTNDVCNGNGQCGVPNTNACNDNNACTINDTCGNGTCTGAPRVCNDDNPCTDDTCNPATGCVFTPNNNNGCSDLNACNGLETCSGGTCIAGSPLVCNDNNSCTNDSCVAATGCSFVPSTANSCSDGNACNGLEACTAQGACQPGTPPNCDDGVDCTTDSCDAGLGCQHALNHSSCNDSNPCTVDTCHATLDCQYQDLNSGACDDGQFCTVSDTCTTGQCVGQPRDCGDGNPCNGVETCSGSSCQAGTPPSCDDGVDCTVDSCVTNVGCQHAPSDAACEDNNDCTDDYCDETLDCQNDPLTQTCDDGEFCTVSDFCTGGQCIGQPRNCDDGNVCNGEESCSGSSCQSGTPLICNDNNPCTDDSCDAELGCVFTDNSDPCSDGNPCTIGDVCFEGGCEPGAQIDCDGQGNQCNDASCDPGAGGPNCDILTPVLDGFPCTDGDFCTISDSCKSGVCAGDPVVCPSDDCNDGVCDKNAQDCILLPVQDGTPCNDGEFCTVSDSCAGGVCEGDPRTDCDDGNPCNGVETCSGTSCQSGTPVNCSQAGDQCNNASCDPGGAPGNCDILTPKSNTTACDDGLYCTVADTCENGFCVGDDRVCPGDDCNVGACNEGMNSCGLTPKPNNTPCEDGDVCTVGDNCQGGSCTGGGAPDCSASDLDCSIAECDPWETAVNCDLLVARPNGTACDDANPCTVDDSCQGGVCAPGSPPVCVGEGDQCNTASCDINGAEGNCDTLTPIANGVSCDDDDPCTVGESCQGGECGGGNPPNCVGVGDPQCQVGSCDENGPDGNCNNLQNKPDGELCNDGDECTENDSCQNGACVGDLIPDCPP